MAKRTTEEKVKDVAFTFTDEQIAVISDMFDAWVGKKKFLDAFVNDCERLVKAGRK